MKRLFAVMLSICLLIGCAVPSVLAASTPAVTLSDASAKPGETVTLTLSLSQNPEISVFQSTIHWDSKVFSYVEDSFSFASSYQGGMTIYNTPEEEELIAAWISLTPIDEDGSIFSFSLDIDEAVEAGTYSVTISDLVIGSDSGENYSYTLTNSTITVSVDTESEDPIPDTPTPDDPTPDDPTPDDPTPVVVNPFQDIKEGDWFYDDIMDAYAMGLINGKTDTAFKPYDNITYAEIVKLAACMNQLYYTDKITLTNGTPYWYSSYETYCLEKGILKEALGSKANAKITRAEYVDIFSRALPARALAPINTIPNNSLPDVKTGDPYASAIYSFYRAGITDGTDDTGTFKPNNPIRRCEVAAILIRMMEPTTRVGAPSKLGA